MKHTTSRMLFGYWDMLRGERAAPERGDVQPAGMRHVLADAFILARDAEGGTRFRLAGTRIGALFARDLRGSPFAAIWAPESRSEADTLVDTVTTDTLGVVAGVVGTNVNGARLPLELLLLPLRHRGSLEARLLGALSPASTPSWAGLVPLAGLETRSIRIVQPQAGPAAPAPDPDALGETSRRRGMFVVHEGGLS